MAGLYLKPDAGPLEQRANQTRLAGTIRTHQAHYRLVSEPSSRPTRHAAYALMRCVLLLHFALLYFTASAVLTRQRLGGLDADRPITQRCYHTLGRYPGHLRVATQAWCLSS